MSASLLFISGNKRFARGSISFVGGGNTQYATATSVVLSIHASTVAGDLLVATVMHRSAMSTPSGWELVGSISQTYSSVTQYLSIFKRTAQAGDASVTFTQVSSARIGGHVLTVRSTTGAFGIVDAERYAAIIIGGVVANSRAQLPRGGGVFIAASSSQLGSVAPETNTVSASGGWVLSSQSVASDNRVGVAYMTSAVAADSSGTINFGLASPENSVFNFVVAIVSG